jgi:hypothetical protein
MFYVLQNESTAALRRVPILLTDAATGTTAQTGVATTNIYPSVNINGGAFAGGAGTVAEAGYGQYYYEFDAAEVATLGLAGIHVTAVGCRDYDAIAQVAAFNVYSASGVGITAADVWNYDISGVVGAGLAGSQLNVAAAGGGTTTGDIATAVWDYSGATVPATVKETLDTINTNASNASSQTGSSAIRDAVWDTDVSYLTSPQAGYALYQAAFGTTSNAPSEVWSYVTREITGGTATTVTNAVLVDPASMTGIAGTVWNTDVSAFLTPSAGYDLTQAASAIGITAGDVWSYATREITGGLANTVTSITNPVEVSTAAMAGIANTVWSTLTAPYTTHATFGHQILRSDNAATIGEVTLHQSGGSKRVDADVHAFVNNTASATAMLNILTGIGASMTTNITGNITGNLSGSVGSVTNAVNVSTTSMTGIASTVWNTDISSISTAGTAGSQLNLAASPSGVGISAYDVWNFDPTAMTSPQAGAILTDIQTDTNSIITDIGNVPNNVWASDVSGYVNPGEAGYELTQAASGSGLTAGDVWTYATREITGGIADTVTTVTNGVTVTTNNDKTGYSLSSTQTFDLTGNITGNLSGSVGSVTADVPVDEAAISADVWSYATREITGGTATTVTNAVLVDTASMSGIANTVWSTDVSGYTSPSAGFDLSNASSGVGISAADVWNYTLTSSSQSADATLGNADDQATNAATNTNSPTLEANVWSYATRTITGGIVTSVGDKTGYSLSSTQAFDVTGNITGNVSGSIGSVTNPVDITTSAMSGTAGSVWNYVTRTLTSSSAPTAADIWSYAGGRTITGGIADTVTTVSNGVTVTTNNDKTGYSLSGTQSFNLTGNITGSVSGSVGSVTGSVGSVVSPVNVSTTSMSGIAGTTWTYVTRTLTSGAGATAGDVWSYNISGITTPGTAGATLNDASVSGSVVTIVNGPYRLTSIAEGTDGRIDILADSVQTIQLNCLDGFGQPFNVTGYAVVVNVYDVSGALAVTYTPTVDFASSGIVSFDIDTDVTGTTGRYTLVVELTAGLEVVQLGPLEILVRPL